MIRRKLVAINTLIIIVTVGMLLAAAARSLQRLFYEESALIYQASMDERYDQMDTMLSEGREMALSICVDNRVQSLLAACHRQEELTAAQTRELENLMGELTGNVGLYSIQILPVNGQGKVLWGGEAAVLYTPEGQVERGYRWEFRPGNTEAIRVTRNIFSDSDIRQVVGIARVDIGLSTIQDLFWTFPAKYDMKATLILLDEDRQVLLPYYTGALDMSKLHEELDSPITYELRSERVILSRTFSQNGWMLVSLLENSALLAGSNDIIDQVFTLGAVLILAGILLTTVASKRITDPILRLAGWMQDAHVAETYEEIPVKKETGEVRILYDSFNRFMGIIRSSIEEIRLAGERERKNEFRMLSSQINPHFLYNTLGSISWMAERVGATEIQEMTVDLVGMLRNGLNHGNTAILLRNELEQVRCYLNIMKKRYPENYRFHFEVEEDVEDYWVIKQLLQPLAENAIQHGILEEGGGELTIAARREGEALVLEVRNTGRPADLEKIALLLQGDESLKSQHYGIRNVNERLKNYYGDQTQLEYSLREGETVVQIHIPLERVLREPEGDG